MTLTGVGENILCAIEHFPSQTVRRGGHGCRGDESGRWECTLRALPPYPLCKSPSGQSRWCLKSQYQLEINLIDFKDKYISPHPSVIDSFRFVFPFQSRRYEKNFSASFWKYVSSMVSMGSHALSPTGQKEQISDPVATGNITLRLYSIRIKPTSQVDKAQSKKESGIIQI